MPAPDLRGRFMTLAHFGIILGFVAAFWQAANYAFTKDAQEKHSLRGIRLLIAVHVFMGIIMLVPFLWLGHYRYVSPETLWHGFLFIAPYLLGQYFSNRAIALSDSSIVSPLLTLKIPIMAVMAFFMIGQHFAAQHYLSIAMIMALGFYFSSLSGRLRLGPLACVLCCCASYCYSDINMVLFMRHLESRWGVARVFDQVLILGTFQYVCCLIPSLPFFAVRRMELRPAQVWQGRWIAISWLVSGMCFVACFNLAGVVEGNIIQSLRSVIGVVIAYLFFRSYIQDPGTFRKKLFVAGGMFSAVLIYYL